MTERALKVIASPDGEQRVLIVQRDDGACTYRRQWLIASAPDRIWGNTGPDLGIYDSADTAEREALARVEWRNS